MLRWSKWMSEGTRAILKSLGTSRPKDVILTFLEVWTKPVQSRIRHKGSFLWPAFTIRLFHKSYLNPTQRCFQVARVSVLDAQTEAPWNRPQASNFSTYLHLAWISCRLAGLPSTVLQRTSWLASHGESCGRSPAHPGAYLKQRIQD